MSKFPDLLNTILWVEALTYSYEFCLLNHVCGTVENEVKLLTLSHIEIGTQFEGSSETKTSFLAISFV